MNGILSENHNTGQVKNLKFHYVAQNARRNFIDIHVSTARSSLKWVPQVPRQPLKFGNGCQAPVLIRNKLLLYLENLKKCSKTY